VIKKTLTAPARTSERLRGTVHIAVVVPRYSPRIDVSRAVTSSTRVAALL